MSKKIGIITFNRASNYGAVLQAYALKNVCEKLGYQVHVINYTKGVEDDNPTPLKSFWKSTNKKRALVGLCRNILGYPWDKKRWKNFVSFRKKYLSESKICNTQEELKSLGYDKYIIGSDQIWNYNITGKVFDPVYFGDFTQEKNCVVYAASAHDTPFPLDKELEFKAFLEHTEAEIGIREKKLADYAGSLLDKSYPVVLDPTLLAGKQILSQLVRKTNRTDKYILMYQIDANPASDISVKTLEKRFNCRVYTMTAPRIGSVHGRKGTAGPEEFLTLLKNAEFLVTNSFHGIALSLLFEKQFYVYENSGVMTRIDGLLSMVGLHNRKVKMTQDIDLNNVIDYEPVKRRLAELRRESQDFLQQALNGEKTSLPAKKKEPFLLKEMKYRTKEECSGCTACVSVCPVSAISMKPDEEGFLYPEINDNKCIHCGKCDQICGFVPTKHKRTLPQAFGVKHKNERTRLTSRSGAAFIAFSDIILQHGGVVYGASLHKDNTVSHIRASSVEDRDKMKGAKYTQSDLTGIFRQVTADLKAGKQVLFSGTPCQVSGLNTYVEAAKLDSGNLYTCDLVCHGVPSPLIWKDYINFIEKKFGKKISKANFRDKSFGWDSHCESFIMDDGSKIVSRDYTDLFYEHIMMRPSCHKCHYANVNRVADLTLADFWGIEKNKAEFNDNKGVSLVLVSSEKGRELFTEASKDLEWFECDVKNCMQPTLVKPTSPSMRRKEFWEDYKIMDFPEFLKKYTTPLSFIQRVKRNLKQLLYKVGVRQHP